jgi:hypothetical protein
MRSRLDTFPGAVAVAQLRRTVEVVYLITSARHTAAPPQRLDAWVQGHWAIETALHWVHDVTFGGWFPGTHRAVAPGDGHLPEQRRQSRFCTELRRPGARLAISRYRRVLRASARSVIQLS